MLVYFPAPLFWDCKSVVAVCIARWLQVGIPFLCLIPLYLLRLDLIHTSCLNYASIYSCTFYLHCTAAPSAAPFYALRHVVECYWNLFILYTIYMPTLHVYCDFSRPNVMHSGREPLCCWLSHNRRVCWLFHNGHFSCLSYHCCVCLLTCVKEILTN